ncbi:unnamed protein product [Brassica oleracea var. botrytis]|uniref:(rape) hypothetical protein n=1 Tax=Brassica napus TaxID=3708 RepID=A0A816U8Q3_BRANA|nr:unnamed protein product [Brassica napus]
MTSELPLTSSIIEASFMKWSRGRGNSELVLMRMWNVWMGLEVKINEFLMNFKNLLKAKNW